ncbi:MAG TPA: helix-hairpin-helix domain-containing protein [Allosphingosinicella sp.]|nr:helix-hairpin-helix domain-containing protein [Allosphingosinicella sp.]
MAQPLDLNAADQAALDAIEDLAGHGHEIVRYRQERGGFTSIDQLDEVPGLTGKVTAAARGRLRIG